MTARGPDRDWAVIVPLTKAERATILDGLKLLDYGFAGDVADKLENERLREALDAILKVDALWPFERAAARARARAVLAGERGTDG